MYKRLLLTGAAGNLGEQLRQGLIGQSEFLRMTDIAPLRPPPLQSNEEFIQCNLNDKQGVIALGKDCDGIVHFGGISTEHSFEEVLEGNIKGVFHIFEAARIHGIKRVIFASSNHAIGFHKQSDTIDSNCAKRPDSYYGLSKAYGEDMGRFYFDRYGIETVCLRIGSSFPEPLDRRMLITWLSFGDLCELVRCSLNAPKVDHTIVYGASNNRDSWWDNSKAAHLGFKPKDNTEGYRETREGTPALDENDPAKIYQGGGYVKMGPF
jgi:uronate dehydrogenase